ncbi:MAG: replication initiation factor domain-containing protein [Methylotenera sp.]
MSSTGSNNSQNIIQLNDSVAKFGAFLRQQGALDASSAESPGVVIPGERLSDSHNSDGSESYELAVVGKRAVLIAHPIPSGHTPGYAAITDYLNCTFPFSLEKHSLAKFVKEFANVVGEQFLAIKSRGKGMNGYQKSFDLGHDGAKFCYGGQRDTALLMLPGMVCHTISDWRKLVELLRDGYGARITRWDGAVDDFEGVHSIEWAVEQYKAGNFTNGGNKPSCRQNGNWITPDGTGRTIYIGKRENGKMLRIYEKGMQCGEPFHPWVRIEVELHNVDRVVPWDVLIDPGKYVAGAYPKALSWIHDEMCRIKTLQKETQLSYKHLVEFASIAYGRLVNVMLEVEGSPEKVVKKLQKEGKPKRLQMPTIPEVKK